MNIPEMNEEMLEKVFDQIQREWTSYDQNKIGVINKDTPCGTTCCIAGWTMLLSTPPKQRKSLFNHYDYDVLGVVDAMSGRTLGEAGKILGLTCQESSFLFGGSHHANPKRQFLEIKERLEDIRLSREIAEMKLCWIGAEAKKRDCLSREIEKKRSRLSHLHGEFDY